MTRVTSLSGIYAVVDQDALADPVALADAAVRAGVGIVQYRAKSGVVPGVARALRELTLRANAVFIVNDDWRAALRYDADGVHLGPGDPGFDDVPQLRVVLGNRIVGLSCGTVEEARTAGEGGADYAGVGPVFTTASKPDAGAPLGLAGLAEIAAATTIPVAAIGGIGLSSVPGVRATGVAMAAVISALAAAADPRSAAGELVAAWNARAVEARR